MRVDFHPDHFVVLNSTDKEVFKHSIQTLRMHQKLLKGMDIPLQNRCVLHVGGAYNDKEKHWSSLFIIGGLYLNPFSK